MRNLIGIIALCFVAINAYAKSPAPPKTDDAISVPATLKADVTKSISIGTNTFEFEKTSLNSIRKALGTGDLDYSTSGATGQSWLCYSIKSETVWFISNADMGGPDMHLTRVQASSNYLGCPKVKPKFEKINSSFGWLGMTKSSMTHLLGKPSGVSGNVYKYLYTGKIPGKYDGKIVNFDVTGYIEATFSGNRVIAINASHITSY